MIDHIVAPAEDDGGIAIGRRPALDRIEDPVIIDAEQYVRL